VSRITGIPTYIDNDANTVATAEKLFGHAREAKNFSIITLSNTVGCAHYIGGKLYRGENGGAGEIGHCLADPDGVLCRCGRIGCLDTVAGFDAILQSAKKHQLAVRSIQDLEALAANGNPHAVGILRGAGHALGMAVANVIQINNPEMALFACTEGLHNGLFATITRQTIENNILPRFLSSTSLHFYPVQKDFWARGAASIAAQEFLIAQVSQKL
jgi:predicted NBD/HSP70 family sugar kinase